jgi:hypothetical protein
MNEERPGTTTAKAHRVQIQLEAGWQVAKQSLTPKLINPTELLTVGTFPMKPGGICAQLPSRAFEAIGENDAVITFRSEVIVPSEHRSPPTATSRRSYSINTRRGPLTSASSHSRSPLNALQLT